MKVEVHGQVAKRIHSGDECPGTSSKSHQCPDMQQAGWLFQTN